MLSNEQVVVEGWKLDTYTPGVRRFVRPEVTILEDNYYIEMELYSGRWNCTVFEVNSDHERTQLFYGTIESVEDLQTMMRLLDLDLPNRDPNRVHVSWKEQASKKFVEDLLQQIQKTYNADGTKKDSDIRN